MSVRFSDDREVAKSLATIEEGGGTNASSFAILPIVGTFAVAAVVILSIIFWPRPAPVQETIPTVIAQQPTAMPTEAPSTIAPYVALIEAHIKRGEYTEAQNVAQGALDIKGILEADRRILNGYIISLGLKIIESTVFEPLDRTQHQRLVDTYLSLRERARAAGVEIESPLQVARRAHASSQFPLAKVAIEEAHKDGLFDPTLDRDITRLYVSVLYGMGEWYTKSNKNSPLYEEGRQALVTSDRIADHYQTGQSEAEALLRQLGDADTATWPAPLDTPLLR